MAKLIGIALGAGITSAVLFVVATTASFAGLALANLAPLPLMIAGLGFTPLAGGLAARGAGGAGTSPSWRCSAGPFRAPAP